MKRLPKPLPIWEKIQGALKYSPHSLEILSAELGVKQSILKVILYRHKDLFARVGVNMWSNK